MWPLDSCSALLAFPSLQVMEKEMAFLREQLETFKKLKYVSIVQAMLSYVRAYVCMYVRMHVHGIRTVSTYHRDHLTQAGFYICST